MVYDSVSSLTFSHLSFDWIEASSSYLNKPTQPRGVVSILCKTNTRIWQWWNSVLQLKELPDIAIAISDFHAAVTESNIEFQQLDQVRIASSWFPLLSDSSLKVSTVVGFLMLVFFQTYRLSAL